MADLAALQVAPDKVQRIALENMGSDETPHVVLVGSSKQTLVALDDRLMIIKPGFMAGSAFGARVTAFNYRDISAIEVNTHMLNAVVEVVASGYQGTKGTSYWSSEAEKDPFKISNCLPTSRAAIKEWAGYLEFIRQKIRDAKVPPSQQPGSRVVPQDTDSGMVSRLQQLAELHQSGAITDEEFSAAKAKLLG